MNSKLGINIDHVATLRNARGGAHPSLLRAATICAEAGADSLTIHLREDRRHIRDADVVELLTQNILPINLELAATDEMLKIALKHRPFAVCIVPEKRQELTTEGGLDVVGNQEYLTHFVNQLNAANIRTSLFVDPNINQVNAAKHTGATCIEIHTGQYAEHFGAHQNELQQIVDAAKHAHTLGLEVHAGHGLNFENVGNIAAITEIIELNIGHFIIGEAIFIGLHDAIQTMLKHIEKARAL